jgi:internalin A
MSFQQLNLIDTQIADLEWCRSIPSIGILWLRGTPVTNLTPLQDVPITSLDIEDTSVSDLSPLSEMPDLRRLSIINTDVTDLWPLTDLQLSRLLFIPSKIETGIEAVRNMRSLTELGTQTIDESNAVPAAEFWQRYDAGEFAATSETAGDSNADDAPPIE